jgi:hypothetical protein
MAREGVDLRRLRWVGPLTVVAAVVAVLAVRVAAFAVLDLSPEFQPLTWGAPILFTTVLVGMGVLVFAVVAMRATLPMRLYRRIAFWALVVSLIPDLLLPGSGPGATWPAALVLMVMHVAAWLTTVTILTRWTVRRVAPAASAPAARFPK